MDDPEGGGLCEGSLHRGHTPPPGREQAGLQGQEVGVATRLVMKEPLWLLQLLSGVTRCSGIGQS